MAKGYKIDYVAQTITIIDSDAIDADGAKQIFDAQQAGYKTVNARKKRTGDKRGEAWYKKNLSADEFKQFEEVKADGGYFAAKKWAKETLGK